MMVPPSREESRRESLRRIQVGVVGLGGVLLLVGLTNLVVDNIRKDSGLAGTGLPDSGAVANVATPSEPLADLGVTPASDSGAQAMPAVPDLQPNPKLQKRMDRDPRQPQ